MRIILVIAIALLTGKCEAQQPYWAKTSYWTIYEIHDGNAFSYSIDTLNAFKGHRLDDSTIHEFLVGTTKLTAEKTPVWMGMYVTTLKMPDGSTTKAEISVYGGFFFIEKLQQYFEVSDENKEAWLKFWHDELERLSE